MASMENDMRVRAGSIAQLERDVAPLGAALASAASKSAATPARRRVSRLRAEHENMRLPTFSDDGPLRVILAETPQHGPEPLEHVRPATYSTAIHRAGIRRCEIGSKSTLKRFGQFGHLIDRRPPDQHITATRSRPGRRRKVLTRFHLHRS